MGLGIPFWGPRMMDLSVAVALNSKQVSRLRAEIR